MILPPGVSVEPRNGVQVVHVKGEIDFANGKAVHAVVTTVVSTGPAPVLVDLSQTTYLDSVGVRMLFEVAADLSAGQRLVGLIVPEGAPIRKVLTITKLDERVPVYRSLEEAILNNHRKSIDAEASHRG